MLRSKRIKWVFISTQLSHASKHKMLSPSNEHKTETRTSPSYNSSSSSTKTKFQFLVFRGNFSNVVRRALVRRPWWRDMVAEDCKSYPKTSQKLNSSHQKLSNERQDFYCNEQLITQQFDFLWKPTSGVRSIAAAITKKGNNGETIKKMGTIHTIPISPSSNKVQLMNHLSNHDLITTKTGLFRSLTNYYKNTNINIFHVVPETFLIASSSSNDTGWNAFYKRFKEIANKQHDALNMPIKHCLHNMWIVKPPNSNQGQGIKVFSSLSKIKKFVNVQKNDDNGNNGQPKDIGDEWVVQKYLERPLLFWGRKFDIRVWVLVTSTFDIFTYKQGYLRTSSSTFSIDKNNESSSFVHLTNYCMQKHSSSVGKYEDGNTLCYNDLQNYINDNIAETTSSNKIDINTQIMNKIKSMIVDTILAGKSLGMGDNSNDEKRKSFELFGYDFMVDDDLRPWLIEVNTNPYLGGQNVWHGELVECMIEDMVRTVVDPLYSGDGDSMDTALDQSIWKQGFEMLYSEKRGYITKNGVYPIDSRGNNSLEWYYSPMCVPINDDIHERRKYISSRDRNVIKAKKRIEQKKKEQKLYNEQEKKKINRYYNSKKNKNYEKNREAMKAVLSSSTSAITSPIKRSNPQPFFSSPQISKISPPTSPILRSKTNVYESIIKEKNDKEERRKLKKEFSNNLRKIHLSSVPSLPSSTTGSSRIKAAATINKVINRDSDYGKRRSTFTAPARRRNHVSSPGSGKNRGSSNSSNYRRQFLPKVDGSISSSHSPSSSSAMKSSHTKYHESVLTPPKILPKVELDKKQSDVLERVKYECEKEKNLLDLKKTQVQILKKKQLAWVKENLNIDKSRIEKRKEKLKLMKEKEDLDKMTAIQNENLRLIEKRKTMKKNWLRRQKIKRDLEIKRKEQLLMDQQLLDELSKKRECDNQIRYNLWKKSKDDAKKKQKLFEIEKLNETNIMLMVDHVNNNSDNSDNSTSTRSTRSNRSNNNNNNFDDDFNNHDSKRGRKYTKESL